MATTWDVHKFGGTSVGSADSMRKCIDIIRPRCDQNRVAMVVSAMGGKPKVTDLLLDSVRAAGNLKLCVFVLHSIIILPQSHFLICIITNIFIVFV